MNKDQIEELRRQLTKEELRWHPKPSLRAKDGIPISLDELIAMSPTDFERFVGKILPAMGYDNVEHVGGAGDRGADLRAVDEYGRRVIIQCKRYGSDNKVGSMELQRFVGAITINDAQKGIVVTTSSFTSEAEAIATKHQVVLVDGAKLKRWIS